MLIPGCRSRLCVFYHKTQRRIIPVWFTKPGITSFMFHLIFGGTVVQCGHHGFILSEAALLKTHGTELHHYKSIKKGVKRLGAGQAWKTFWEMSLGPKAREPRSPQTRSQLLRPEHTRFRCSGSQTRQHCLSRRQEKATARTLLKDRLAMASSVKRRADLSPIPATSTDGVSYPRKRMALAVSLSIG